MPPEQQQKDFRFRKGKNYFHDSYVAVNEGKLEGNVSKVINDIQSDEFILNEFYSSVRE